MEIPITLTQEELIAFALVSGLPTVGGYLDSSALAHIKAKALVPAGSTWSVFPVSWPFYWKVTYQEVPAVPVPTTPVPTGGCECECEPLEVVIYALGPMDDDMRVRVNSTVAFNPKCNVSWYSGEVSDFGNASFNLLWQTTGFRIARLTRELMHGLGCRILPGAVISVDGFDGWGGWGTAPWRAEVVWPSGLVSEFAGGSSIASQANGIYKAGDELVAGYYSLGPWFEFYSPNGSFVVPCPPAADGTDGTNGTNPYG